MSTSPALVRREGQPVPQSADEAHLTFQCQAYLCRMTGGACAKQHLNAKAKGDQKRDACISCPAGAARAQLLGMGGDGTVRCAGRKAYGAQCEAIIPAGFVHCLKCAASRSPQSGPPPADPAPAGAQSPRRAKGYQAKPIPWDDHLDLLRTAPVSDIMRKFACSENAVRSAIAVRKLDRPETPKGGNMRKPRPAPATEATTTATDHTPVEETKNDPLPPAPHADVTTTATEPALVIEYGSPLPDGLMVCSHPQILPYGDGGFGRCAACNDGSFPLTPAAAGMCPECGSYGECVRECPMAEPEVDAETLAALGEGRLTPAEVAHVAPRLTNEDRGALRDIFGIEPPDEWRKGQTPHYAIPAFVFELQRRDNAHRRKVLIESGALDCYADATGGPKPDWWPEPRP